ncbi:MAG TPA: calcium-binding protein, partial [Opitutaceae bacterium]|nr:calcium-binding protein [Opitutaceae bacterium]
MTSNSQRSEYVFEALEPRLLLSADGLSAAGMDPEIERDVVAQHEEPAVVVAYAMDSTSAATADAGDDIFDVAGQTMEAAVEASEPAADSVVEASVAPVSTADSGASGTEPVAMASVYDGGSAMTQQLVETLNASNAPPSEVDGDAAVSSLSSTIGSDGSGDLQTQALSVLEGGEGNVPSIQADLDSAITGATGALEDGFAAVFQALADLLAEDPLFKNYVPGFLTTLQRGDDVVVVSPTLAQALTTPVDVFTDGALNSGFGEGLSGTNSEDGDYTNSLADRFRFIEFLGAGPLFADMKAEFALDAMDINTDGVVDATEMIAVMVFGQIENFAASTSYGDAEEFAANFAGELMLEFAVNDFLTFNFAVSFTATSSIHGDDVLIGLHNLTLTMGRYEQVDLGYLADELKIGLDPGTPPDPGDPTRLLVTKSLKFDTLVFGFSGGASGPVNSDDFFFAAPGSIEVAVEMDGTVNNMEVNVGFLGTKVIGGDGFDLEMSATGVATDPTNPSPLGFTSYPIIGASGTVTAPDAPSVFDLENDVQFSLGIGTKAYSPFREITVGATETDGFDEIGDLVTLIQGKVNAAFGSGLITVSDSGGKIAFTLVSTTPSVAGIQDELAAIDAIDLGIVFIEANAVSTYIGTDANPFSVPEFSFLISLNGALPVRVVVPGFDATFVDEPDPTADYYEVTVDDFIDAIQDALDAAGLGVITVQDANGNDRLEFWTSGDGPSLEISKTIFFDTVEKITIGELSEYGAEIFVFTPDASSNFEVDLELQALPGIEKPDDTDYLPTGTINVDLDPFDQEPPAGTLADGFAIQPVVVDTIPGEDEQVIKAKFDLQFDAGMVEMLDFNVLGPSEMLGIINQVAIWLDRVVATQLFTAFDLPFAQASLASILNFGAMMRATFLIDGGVDGVVRPEADTWPDDIDDKQRLMAWVQLEFGGEYQLVTMFTNAQQLEYRLAEIVNIILDERGYDIFGAVDDDIRDFVMELIDATYDVTTKELTYRLDTDHNLEGDLAATPILQPQDQPEGVSVPMDFALDLDPLGDFVTESMLFLSGEGRFAFTLGVKLGDAAAALDLDSLLLTDLNDGRGVTVNTNIALSSLIDIEPIVGRLSSDAFFDITLVTNSGTTTYEDVRILRNEQPDDELPNYDWPFTSDNLTFADLLADINNALKKAEVTDDGTISGNLLVEAVAERSGTGDRDTGRIVLRPTAAGAAITALRISTSSGNSAYFELGLPSQSASTAYLIAPEPMAGPIPGDEVVFSISIQRGGVLEGPKIVTVRQTPEDDPGTNKSWSNNNSTLSDLVNDVNAALVAAGLGSDIVAGRSGSTLILFAINSSVRGFFVTPELSAANKLGLDDAAAEADLTAAGVNVAEVNNALSTGVLLRARDTISNPFGRLGVDLDFNINGTQVQLSASETANNSTILSLVRNLNEELNGIDALKGRIIASNDGLNLVFRAIDPSIASITVTGFDVAGEGEQIGFQNNASADSALRIVANLLAPVSFGVTAPAAFSIAVTDPVNGNLAWNATLNDQATITNRNLFDLAADLNQAMNAGFITTYWPGDNTITANDNPLIAVVQGDRIVIGLKTVKGGSALVADPSVAAEEVTGFSITAPGDSTLATELGLVPTGGGNQSNEADRADFVIYFSDGTYGRVELDDLVDRENSDDVLRFKLSDTKIVADVPEPQTIQDLLDSILGQKLFDVSGAEVGTIGDRLTIGIRSDGSGLVLSEPGFDLNNPNVFRVVAVNGSPAALQLGILASDTTQLDVGQYEAAAAGSPDGSIEGARIATLDILDRVFIEDPNLTATIELRTDGVATAEGNFGFVGIRLTSAADLVLYDAEVSVPFITDGNGRVNLDELFSALNTISNLWQLVDLPVVTGGTQTDFDLSVEIWPASDIIDGLFELPADPSVNFDIVGFGALEKYQSENSDAIDSVRLLPIGDVDVTHVNLGTLANFETLLLDDVLDALETFADFLAEFNGFGFLAQDIPLLGESINALLDVANRFAAAIETVRLNPSGGLQSLAQALRQGFGLPEFADAAERDAFFEARGILLPSDLIAFDLLDLNGTEDLMRFDLRIPVSFVQSRSVDLDLGEVDFLGGSEVVDLQGGAGLSVIGYLDTHLSFGIDLVTPSDVYLFENATGLFGAIKAKADNLVFNAAIGPMGIFIRDGSAEINVEFGMDNGAFVQGDDAFTLIDGDVTDLVDGDGGAAFGPNFLGEIKATLPVFFPDDSTYLGDIVLDISQANGNALVLSSPIFTPPNLSDPNTLSLPDFSFIDLAQLNPFNSLPQLLDTLDFFLAGLQDILDGEVFGFDLPLIGDKLSSGADFIEDIRRKILEPIRQFVEQSPDAGEELIEKLLEALLGGGSDGIDFGGMPLQQFLGLTNPISGLGLLNSIETEEIDDGDGYIWKLALGDTYTPPVEIKFDLGFPALGLSMDSGLVINITWNLALSLGISRSDGAFILMGGHGIGPTGNEELTVEVDISLPPGSEIEGRLGFLQLIAEDEGTFFHAEFVVDVFNGQAPDDERLSFSELGLMDIDVSLSAQAVVDLMLTLQFNDAILPDTISALLPKLKAGFRLDWDTGDIFSDEFDFASSLHFVGFYDVRLDMGSFLSDFLGPIVNKIAEITKPLQPVIDVFTTRIPVLSDLAGRTITLLDIAGMFGVVDTGMIYAIADIITLVNEIAGISSDTELLIPLGDFTLFDRDNANPNLSNGEFAENLALPTFDLGDSSDDPDFDFDSFLGDTGQIVDDFAEKLAESADGKSKELSQSLLNKTAPGAGNFSFPLLDNPSLAFGLLLGRDIALVEYDLPPFGVDFTYVQKFPIWGPLFARITGSVGLTIDLAFGYDTYGVRKFAQGNFSNPLDLLAGFYVNDTDQPNGAGTDVPELILRGELFAGAEINLGIATAGVEGGIILTINFDLYDPDGDGKVRIDELVGNFLYEFRYGGGPATAPIAIFDVFGDVAVQLRAFIEFLFFEKTFEITPPITIVEFSIEFDREPILATERGDGALVLNIGPNSASRLNGDTRDIDEQIYVKSVSSNEVLVWSDQFNVAESAAQSYHIGDNKLIIVYGGDGNDVINLDGLGDGIKYFVDAGAGDDVVVGGQAGGEMYGGLGNDTLTGGDGRDLIVGGLGNDKIDGGGGDDWLFGDNGSVSEFVLNVDGSDVDMIRFRALATVDDGDDTIRGGEGNDIVFGGGGYDLIYGGEGNDLLIGDGGYFEGPASSGGIPTSNGFVDVANIITRGIGANDRIYGGAGNDTILGGPGNDLLDGGSDNDVVLGGTGNDIVYGGAGSDWLFGDEGDDIIFGYRDPFGPANFGLDPDDLANDIDPVDDLGDYIEGGDGNDFIRGQGGDDRIHGNRGADIIFGDQGDDVIGAGFVDRPWMPAGADLPYNSEAGGDIIFGGADDDTINAGTGADIVFGDDGLVVFLFFTDTSGMLASNELGSRIRTDSGGVHKLIGDGDETELIKIGDLTRNDGYDPETATQSTNTTPDLYATEPLATDGDDYIAGGDGNDIVFGGGGNDTIYGDFDPTQPLFGPRPFGQDVLIGDGGRVELYGRRYQAIEAIANLSFDGVDTISGNDGGDFIFGGGNEDVIFGFQNPAQGSQTPLEDISENDSIFGDNGRIEFDPSDRFNRITRMFTTYAGAAESGASDSINGQWGDDIIFGGLNSSSDIISGGLGNDIVIGDQGEVLFYAPGLGAGWHQFAGDDFPTFDLNFFGNEFWLESFPLFLVRSYPDNLGGVDIISGNEGHDILIGGTAGDFMYGDDPTGSSGAADGDDIMLGDNGEVWFNIDFEEPDFDDDGDPIGVPNTSIGRLTAQVAAMPYASAIDRIRTSDTLETTGGADTMSGNAGADIIFGGVNNGSVDLLYGDRESPTAGSLALDRDDILVGDNGVVDFAFDGDTDRTTLDLIRSYEDALGGTDIISGDAGSDVGIGGTGGDVIYGDRATPNAASLAADGNDTLIGDNADIFLVTAPDPLPPAGGDLKLVLGSAVYLIRTTDDNYDPNVPALNTGGVDTIAGNAKSDIILGGVEGDYLYGDGVLVVFVAPDFDSPINGDWTFVSRLAVKSGADGADIILGDNGALEWLSDGGFDNLSGIDVGFENPALWDQFQGGPDTDLDTLDLVTTEQKLNGGRDWIWGGDGNDAILGGTDSDTLFGDNGFGALGGIVSGTADNSGAGDGGDLMFGDHGRLYPQFSAMWNGAGDWRDSLHSRNFFAIDVGQNDGGEGDRMWGQGGDDNMLGQQGDDRMWGGHHDDDMIGGHNVRSGWDELGLAGVIQVSITNDPGDGDETQDFNDIMDGDDGDDVMAGDNAIIWRRGDTNDPRFRSLTATSIYTTDADTITTNIEISTNGRPNPTGADGRDVTLLDHDFDIQGNAQGRYGRDIMAGGAAEDRMFGQLGDDLMQGDGSIDLVETLAVYLRWPVTAPGLPDDNNPGAPELSDSYVDLFFNIPEQLTDGSDYMEGNGGADLMFGGLGQDDMIGGSSALYGLDSHSKRPDGSDIMFGGAGIRTERNDIGENINGIAFATYNADQSVNVLPTGHASDADFMMGDNANIYRLVSATTGLFLTFNYDDYAGGVRIIPRAMEQIDYHLGGADYNTPDDPDNPYVNGAAHLLGQPLDNGAADFMHGEAGDDIMFGMTGSDLMFGGPGDDDLIGGYGNDWISGGTGKDGVLGDDGLIYTSRNSTLGEPLNNVAGLLANDPSKKYSHGTVLDELISTPGDLQIATINISGALKKSADLTPFSYDPNWLGLDDEYPDDATNTPFADDIIFGGLGSDWLHGGSGDDAMSGAEALSHAFVTMFNAMGAPIGVLDLGYHAVGLPNGPWVFLG